METRINSVACITYTNFTFLFFRPEPQDPEKNNSSEVHKCPTTKKPKKLEIFAKSSIIDLL
jgi:hypothetical protein